MRHAIFRVVQNKTQLANTVLILRENNALHVVPASDGAFGTVFGIGVTIRKLCRTFSGIFTRNRFYGLKARIPHKFPNSRIQRQGRRGPTGILPTSPEPASEGIATCCWPASVRFALWKPPSHPAGWPLVFPASIEISVCSLVGSGLEEPEGPSGSSHPSRKRAERYKRSEAWEDVGAFDASR